MDNQPLLSLCIPTNGAVNWILPVIDSIYSQGFDNSKFEVVITDNGKDSQLPNYIAKMNYPNLRYRQTADEGFLNLVSCLKDGKGLFCKMINHRSIMLPGSIADLISFVDKYKNQQPTVYCSNGVLSSGEILECANTDAFVDNLTYYCSWSAGIGFWHKDIKNIDSVNLNEMFPNTSLLFYLRPQDSQFVIYNKKIYQMGDDSGKGGYNLFETFSVTFLDLINELRVKDRITLNTFLKVKSELYCFLREYYIKEVLMPTTHTFILENIESYMDVYYGHYYYEQMVRWAKIHCLYRKVKRFLGIEK